jgi:hypothetical protein
MKYLYILLVVLHSLHASTSTDITVEDVGGNYQLSWPSDTGEVTLVRGDFDNLYMVFTETTVYSGNSSSYIDTVANKNTKFYRLEYNGGKLKKDINIDDDMYFLLTDNEIPIQHDQDSIMAEVRMAVFGRVALVKWFSIVDGYKVVLDRSGSTETFINLDNDNHKNKNMYIIDNINGLTSMTVYKIHEDNTSSYNFKLTFDFGEVNGTTNITQIIAGVSSNVSVYNGQVVNGDINTEQNGIFSDGSGSGGGGGCFLR